MVAFIKNIDSKFLAIQLLFLVTFGLAALAKFQTPLMPDSFVETFRHTWLVQLPGGLFTTYYTIALIESAIFILFAISLLKLEFLTGHSKSFLRYGLVLSLFVFLILSYGLRLTSQFQGTANTFFYFGVTLLALWITERDNVSERQT